MDKIPLRNKLLEAFTVTALRELSGAVGVFRVSGIPKNELIQRIISHSLDTEAFLSILSRDDLKVLCEHLGLDSSGKEKQVIIDRILYSEARMLQTFKNEKPSLDLSENQIKTMSISLERMRERLLDLSLRNNLLNFRDKGAKIVKIIDEIPNHVYQHLVESEKPMTLSALPSESSIASTKTKKSKEDLLRRAVDKVSEIEREDKTALNSIETEELPLFSDNRRPQARHLDGDLQTSLKEDEFDGRLRNILSEMEKIEQTTGSNMLYLAIGFLGWNDPKKDPEKSRVSPLILIPIELSRSLEPLRTTHNALRASTYRYSIRYNGGDVVLNLALKYKLRKDYGFDLPEFDEEDTPDSYLKTLGSNLKAWRNPVKDSWNILRIMRMGFFTFNKDVMYRDLDPDSWADGSGLVERGLIPVLLGENALNGYKTESFSSEAVEAELQSGRIPTIVDADSSQMKVLMRIARGDNLIVQGPPGTGKSQTITNMIATALSQGKRVLFMAEKMPALNVVKHRLDAVGVGVFCLELHSKAANPSNLCAQVQRRITYRPGSGYTNELANHVKKVNEKSASLNGFCTLIGEQIPRLDLSTFHLFWLGQRAKERIRDAFKNANVLRAPLFWNEAFTLHSAEDLPDLSALDRTKLLLSAIKVHHEESIPSRAAAWKGFSPPWLTQEHLPEIRASLKACIDVLQPITSTPSNSLARTTWRTSSLSFGRELSRVVLGFPEIPTPLSQEILSEISTERITLESASYFRESLNYLWNEVPELSDAISKNSALSDHYLDETQKSLEALFISTDFGTRSLSELDAIAIHLEQAHQTLAELIRIGADLSELTTWGSKPATIQEALDLATRLDFYLALDRETINTTEVCHFDPRAISALKYGKEKSSLLKERRAEIEKTFDSKSVPSHDNLTLILQTYRESMISWFRWLPFGKFADNRKTISRFVRDPRIIRDASFMGYLNELSVLPTEEAKFNEDKTLLDQLGQIFKGTESRWELLEGCVELAKSISSRFNEEQAPEFLKTLRSLKENPEIVSSLISKIRGLTDFFVGVATSINLTTPGGVLAGSFDGISSEISTRRKQLLGFLNQLLPLGLPRSAKCREAIGYVQYAKEARVRTRWLEDLYLDAPVLKGIFEGPRQDMIAAVRHAMLWAEAVQPVKSHSKELFVWLLSSNSPARFLEVKDLANAFLRLDEELPLRLAALAQSAQGAATTTDSYFHSDSPHSIDSLLEAWHAAESTIDLLPRWSDYQISLDNLRSAKCHHLLDFLLDHELPLELAHDLAEASFFELWISWVFHRNPSLKSFQRVSHELLREEFISLDKELPKKHRIALTKNVFKDLDRIPLGSNVGGRKAWTNLHMIRHQLSLQMRHAPVREWVRRAGDALLDLMPCWMMGPAAVAQFLPKEEVFDLLIMDEASQIRPEDAIGALARARQVVVVGDSKQMPPSDSFVTDLALSEEEDGSEDLVSVLDYMGACLDAEPLRWHYRSQHHHLILFSNERFYEKNLIIPPSAWIQNPKLGIQWHYTPESRYQAGINPLEAQEVVNQLVAHITEQSKIPLDDQESVGVVVMNDKQKALVDELFQSVLENDSILSECRTKFRPKDDIFIRNLENVQGDERDVIIIGFTYGKDPSTERVYQRFGPINKKGGWRRLNVLFTRARKRIHVFSGMLHSDIIGQTQGEQTGVNDLKAYLEFASTGHMPDYGKVTGKDPDSAFEESVAAVVSRLGFEPRFQIGVDGFKIDIGVLDPNDGSSFICGIECDGAPYHSHPVARDRDRIRQEILEARGWKIFRIWSLDWYRNRSSEEERLSAFLRGR